MILRFFTAIDGLIKKDPQDFNPKFLVSEKVIRHKSESLAPRKMRGAHFHHLITSSNIVLLLGGPNSSMSPNLEASLTSSPPKPVSSIQHNYSNIHQPIPRPTSLTSSRTQSSNSTESPTGGVAIGSEGGAFTKVRTPPMEEAKKSKLAEIDDLIHLESPISEDLVIRTLQARFVNQKFMVNFFSK